MPAWRGERLQQFLAACEACETTGSKTDHYFETPEACDTCIFFAKPVRSVFLCCCLRNAALSGLLLHGRGLPNRWRSGLCCSRLQRVLDC